MKPIPTRNRLIEYLGCCLQLDDSEFVQIHRDIIKFLLQDLIIERDLDLALKKGFEKAKGKE